MILNSLNKFYNISKFNKFKLLGWGKVCFVFFSTRRKERRRKTQINKSWTNNNFTATNESAMWNETFVFLLNVTYMNEYRSNEKRNFPFSFVSEKNGSPIVVVKIKNKKYFRLRNVKNRYYIWPPKYTTLLQSTCVHKQKACEILTQKDDANEWWYVLWESRHYCYCFMPFWFINL